MKSKSYTVADLKAALKNVPDTAVVYVRVIHDAAHNPGCEGYEPVWGDVSYVASDNSLNIE